MSGQGCGIATTITNNWGDLWRDLSFEREKMNGSRNRPPDFEAGALGIFPDLVRRVSAKVRGDDSTLDTLGLNDMNRISLSNGRLHYGIDINKVFWVKEKIITLENMRKSRDEELVAQLLAYMIIGESMNPSKRSLDGLYHYEDDDEGLSARVENGINRIGVDTIISWFEVVFSEILLTLHTAGKDFCTLLYENKKPESISRAFQVSFLAFFGLIVNKKKRISDYQKLVDILRGCGPRTFAGIKSRDNWSAKIRAEKVKSVMAIIEPAFVDVQGGDVAISNWTSQIDNLLHKSSIEGGQYDFKVGFHDLKTGNLNEELIKKCVEILTAEVNLAPKTKGYILIGIADKKETAEFWGKTYTADYLGVEGLNFYVVGLNKEMDRYYKNGDEYVRKVKQVISTCNIAEDVKKYIFMNMKMVQYYGKDILVLELESGMEPVSYNDEYYIREGNDTNKLSAPMAVALSKRFASKNKQG